jgi:hypothetical protein
LKEKIYFISYNGVTPHFRPYGKPDRDGTSCSPCDALQGPCKEIPDFLGFADATCCPYLSHENRASCWVSVLEEIGLCKDNKKCMFT